MLGWSVFGSNDNTYIHRSVSTCKTHTILYAYIILTMGVLNSLRENMCFE